MPMGQLRCNPLYVWHGHIMPLVHWIGITSFCRENASARRGSGHTLGPFYTGPTTATLIYVGWRRAGARFGGWVGVLRDGGFGFGRVIGSLGARATVAPWCATSSEAPWSRV